MAAMGITGRLGKDAALIALLMIAGIAVRLAWLAQTPAGLFGFIGGGEAARVALSLAREGRFADAFWAGSGPTAHLMPVSPVVAAGVFRMFPPDSAAASLVLLGWALAQLLASTVLLRLLFARLGAGHGARNWATGFVLLAPIYFPEETIGFRYWDNGLAACLTVANLIVALGVEQRRALSASSATGAAALWTLTFFTHPVAGAALALVWAWVALRRLPPLAAIRFAGASATMLAAVLIPWSIRNAHALGEPVLLRSNFGLEIAIGNHPAAVAGDQPAKVYLDRLAAIHPLYGGAGKAAFLREGGEVPYARKLGRETWAWAIAHPLSFARLTLRHLSEFLFPRPWQMLSSSWEAWLWPRATLLALTDLVGIATIVLGVTRRRPGAALLAIFVAGVALPYGLVQPMPRYTYLVWGLLAFAAADGVFRAIAAGRPGAARAR